LLNGAPFSPAVGDTTLAYIPGVSGWRNVQWNGENRRETRANGQVDLVSRFKLGPFQNTVLTGIERNEERVRSNSSTLRYNPSLAQNANYTIPGVSIQVPNYVSYWYNIYSAESTAARDAFAARNVRSLSQFTSGGSINDALTESRSFYGNWAASFNESRGRIAVGGRYDSFSAETRTRSGGTDPYALDGAVTNTSTGSRNRATPQAGLSYRVTDAITIYSLYSESVNPIIRFQPARTVARENTLNLAYAEMGLPAPDLSSKPWGEMLEPEYGTSFEAGVKTDLFENKVSASVALFTIDRKNIAQTVGSGDPDRSVSFLELVGAMRARGVDVDFYVRPTPGLQIGGGFLYNDTQILKAPLVMQNAAYATGFTGNNGPQTIVYDPVGKPLANAAKWSGNGYVRYDWSSGALQGFGAGLYFTYLGPRADSNTAATRNEDWNRFDLNLSYRTKIREHRVSYAIVVKNLADKFYRVDRDTFAQGRSFLFSASFEY
jgi:outer membrane receptor protein involved in Fe transport